jgi:hypothetical protein
MKQMEEKKGQQEGQEGRDNYREEGHHEKHKDETGNKELDSSREPLLASPNDGTTPNPKSNTPAPKAQPSPDQIYQGKLGDDSGSEDSDDDDGGVALFGPTLGRLPLRFRDGNGGVDGLEGDLDLD